MFFFFNDTATTEIYTLSLHDALPIFRRQERGRGVRLDGPRREASRRPGRARGGRLGDGPLGGGHRARDRKSTRLNSSHANISYAVFCLKKKNLTPGRRRRRVRARPRG